MFSFVCPKVNAYSVKHLLEIIESNRFSPVCDDNNKRIRQRLECTHDMGLGHSQLGDRK